MNKQKSIDLNLGFRSEEEIHSYLENYFGSLRKTKDNINYGKYFEFDKYNDYCFIELKTRRIKHNQYHSLFFGKNKYIKGQTLIEENPNIRIFYIWRCLDGVYYWEHGSSEYTEEISGRRDRGKIEENVCIHISQVNLTKLEDNKIINI